MTIQCNWCETEFAEEDIIVEEHDGEDKEICPNCWKWGYLMDAEVENV